MSMLRSPITKAHTTTAGPFDPTAAWRGILEGQHAALEMKSKKLEEEAKRLKECCQSRSKRSATDLEY